MSLGLLAAIISVAGEIPYIIGIVRGRVRPERASWAIWTIILLVAVWSYEASGAEATLWFIIGELVACALIFALSLWRGSGGLNHRDSICVGIAIAGVLAWQIVDEPALAMLAVIVADMAGVYPTVVKALRDPHSESITTFATSTAAAALGVLSVAQWDMLLLAYPAYLFIANIVVTLVVAVGQYHVRDSAR